MMQPHAFLFPRVLGLVCLSIGFLSSQPLPKAYFSRRPDLAFPAYWPPPQSNRRVPPSGHSVQSCPLCLLLPCFLTPSKLQSLCPLPFWCLSCSVFTPPLFLISHPALTPLCSSPGSFILLRGQLSHPQAWVSRTVHLFGPCSQEPDTSGQNHNPAVGFAWACGLSLLCAAAQLPPSLTCVPASPRRQSHRLFGCPRSLQPLGVPYYPPGHLNTTHSSSLLRSPLKDSAWTVSSCLHPYAVFRLSVPWGAGMHGSFPTYY